MILQAVGKPHRHLWPCRPGAARELKMIDVMQKRGFRTQTGLMDYLIDLGLELDAIRAAENTRIDSRLADAEFWKKALPFMGGR